MDPFSSQKIPGFPTTGNLLKEDSSSEEREAKEKEERDAKAQEQKKQQQAASSKFKGRSREKLLEVSLLSKYCFLKGSESDVLIVHVFGKGFCFP